MTRLHMDRLGRTLVVASHHVPNIGNAITPLTMGPIGTTLGWSRPSNTSAGSAAKPFPWYLVVTANRTVNVLVLWGVKWLHRHISVKNRPILMKFGTLRQIFNPVAVT